MLKMTSYRFFALHSINPTVKQFPNDYQAFLYCHVMSEFPESVQVWKQKEDGWCWIFGETINYNIYEKTNCNNYSGGINGLGRM